MTGRLKLKNLKSRWYPGLDFSAQATYQSETVQIDPDLPFEADFPTPSRDQYKATVEISQLLYDGGMVKASRKSERIGEKVDNQSVRVDLHQVKEQVMEVYFGILLLNKQRDILESTRKELDGKLATVKAAVEHGTLLPSDLKTIQAEKLHLEQNMDELTVQVHASYQVLGELTGLKTDSSMVLDPPELEVESSAKIERPENKLFDLRSQRLKAQSQVIRSERRPTVSAFAQVGYGKPGLNMLSDQFKGFYYVGARLSWNIWDWGQNQRQRQITRIEREKIDTRERAFNQNIQVQLSRIESTISQYQKALEKDDQIINLRRQVTQSARSKLKNGVITSADYIADLNELTQARITHERHQIELLRAKAHYQLTTGKMQ